MKKTLFILLLIPSLFAQEKTREFSLQFFGDYINTYSWDGQISGQFSTRKISLGLGLGYYGNYFTFKDASYDYYDAHRQHTLRFPAMFGLHYLRSDNFKAVLHTGVLFDYLLSYKREVEWRGETRSYRYGENSRLGSLLYFGNTLHKRISPEFGVHFGVSAFLRLRSKFLENSYEHPEIRWDKSYVGLRFGIEYILKQ